MTTSVDVIALLHEVELSLMIDGRGEEQRQLADVITAVAELIEALDKLFGADMECCMEMDGKEDQLEAVQFAKSALANAKGA